MVLRKEGLEQMQVMSRLEHPPMLEPLVCALIQGCCKVEVSCKSTNVNMEENIQRKQGC
jgi:hypothetical protein